MAVILFCAQITSLYFVFSANMLGWPILSRPVYNVGLLSSPCMTTPFSTLRALRASWQISTPAYRNPSPPNMRLPLSTRLMSLQKILWRHSFVCWGRDEANKWRFLINHSHPVCSARLASAARWLFCALFSCSTWTIYWTRCPFVEQQSDYSSGTQTSTVTGTPFLSCWHQQNEIGSLLLLLVAKSWRQHSRHVCCL